MLLEQYLGADAAKGLTCPLAQVNGRAEEEAAGRRRQASGQGREDEGRRLGGFTDGGTAPTWVIAARVVMVLAFAATIPTILGVEHGNRLVWTVVHRGAAVLLDRRSAITCGGGSARSRSPARSGGSSAGPARARWATGWASTTCSSSSA